jgi:hypothetical protein
LAAAVQNNYPVRVWHVSAGLTMLSCRDEDEALTPARSGDEADLIERVKA